ncbi:hypothetical protein GCM10010201_20120 [Pilimelia columellifera subsp. columellifera]|uniref:Large ribosomal subunit protein bL31 n=2 Tax=Pilimelia TaxID=53370 RepID=A0ABN3NH39_9ACTN
MRSPRCPRPARAWQTGEPANLVPVPASRDRLWRPDAPPAARPDIACATSARRPATIDERTAVMKQGIHPEYVSTQVSCSCGSTFTTRSTAKGGSIHVETCSACHPFYTGKQRVLDTAGRVAKFQAKYGKISSGKK